MDERLEFVALPLDGVKMAALGPEFGIWRKADERSLASFRSKRLLFANPVAR